MRHETVPSAKKNQYNEKEFKMYETGILYE